MTASTHRLWSRMTGHPSLLTQRRRGSIHHYLLAVALMGLALLVRLAVAPVSAGIPYVTFFPAVALAVVAGGFGAGLCATIIGLVFATCIFTPPYYSFSIEILQTSYWSNMAFFSGGVIVSFSIEAMHQYRQQYANELKEVKETQIYSLRLPTKLGG